VVSPSHWATFFAQRRHERITQWQEIKRIESYSIKTTSFMWYYSIRMRSNLIRSLGKIDVTIRSPLYRRRSTFPLSSTSKSFPRHKQSHPKHRNGRQSQRNSSRRSGTHQGSRKRRVSKLCLHLSIEGSFVCSASKNASVERNQQLILSL